MIQPGRYRHVKGKDYEVVGVAKHRETEDEFDVYANSTAREVSGSARKPCSWSL